MGDENTLAGTTKAHKHSATSSDGGFLETSVTGMTNLAQGSILYGNATEIQTELTIGGAGDSLKVNGAGTGIEWVAGSDPHASGMVVTYAGTNATIPSGWLLCDGSSVATATYPDLFTALGYAYGGAGANFNLPNMVGVFAKGSATQTATTGGSNSKTLSITEIPAHNHTINDAGHYHDSPRHIGTGVYRAQQYNTNDNYSYDATPPTSTETTGITINDTGGSGSFDNQPAFMELQYIIKT
jgi:microcystin-dependent protein